MSVAASPYLDPALAVADRVDDLLRRMTLEEKLAQLGSIWVFEILDGARVAPRKAQERLGTGIGQITRVAGATSFEMPVVAALANEIQRFLVQETRLGVPAIVHEECLHGLVARDAVCFPQSIGLAAAWDPELIEALACSFARQLRAMGAHQGLAPIFDVARDPRWGRIEETYGEDPYLIAALGVAYVRGLQQGAGAPVLATGKHMVGHGLPEGGMNRAPAHIGPRELRDVYLWPFEAAVREAGMRSMMHAYEDVDGVPCVASRELFTTTLRDEWGFDGIVVSDYAGIDELVQSHAIVGDLSAAAVLALEAGIDVELPSTVAFGAPLAAALADGRVDPALVGRAVARVLAVKFELGLFEAPYVDVDAARPRLHDDRALAREAARASIVLLGNDGTLPLRGDLQTIAVIGPNADSARNLLGDYAHIAHIETLLEMRDNPIGFPVPDDLNLSDELEGRSTILDAIRERCSSGADVRFASGGGVLDASDAELEQAVAAARGADVAIVVVGERSGLTLDCTCGEMPDRMELGLPGRQEELVAAVAATGTPLVLVLVSGRPLAIPEAAGRAAAVLNAWVPGDEGPAAISAILFGDDDPGGKLPVTVPRHVGQVPIYYAHKPSGGRSHWHGDYVDGSNLPLWPFGHGLSYTRFALHGPELDRTTLALGDEVAISVEVENVGERSGDEVLQLYARDEEASVTRPVKELRGFRRVHLAPGERRRVTFRLAAEQLAFTGLDGTLVHEPGRVRLMVGTSSAELPCQADIELTGATTGVPQRSRYLTEVAVE
ncbi:MAG TPA: glycoside hydrolase family 3 N-terminal domain-containing protein [Solirubrobacteraceae bacterium]|nr:glycoside hydrolase family 3 N-terminal domain-containing protein [Solirubrobacteraceae bacterium]